MKIVLIGLGVAAVSVALLLALLPKILHGFGLHPDYHGATYQLTGKRALVVTTSHSVLALPGEEKGQATGVFGSELTHPYYTFLDSGFSVDVASVKGGEIPIDPSSFYYMMKTPEDRRYLEDSVAQAKVENSIPISDIDPNDYDVIFISGGWGAAYDLAQSAVLAEKISEAYYAEHQPILGGVCHGVLGLVSAVDRAGQPLVAGRRMTGVTDKQIKELGIEVTPKHPEAELRKAGAKFESVTAFRDMFATHVTVDDDKRFVTGQNQNSGLESAHTIVGLLAERGK